MHPLVAINKFMTDTSTELEKLQTLCAEMGVKAILTECREKGGDGALDLAREVCESIEKKESDFWLFFYVVLSNFILFLVLKFPF